MSDAIRESDARALSALLTETMPHHPVSERRLRHGFFEHPGFDPALARCERGAGGRIDSAVAAVRLPDGPTGPRAGLLFAATREERCRKGLARALYAEVEGEIRRRGGAEIVAGHGLTRLDLRYSALVTMLLRRIYVQTDVGYDMTIPEGQPVLPVPETPGFTVRSLAPSDAGTLEAFCEAEFPNWRGTSKMILPGEPCGVEGAFDPSGKLAAFAGWDEYVFGPTGTAKAFRRHGLGSAVFWQSVRNMAAAGCRREIIIGFANVPYYARAFGSPISGVVWNMRKDLRADPAISKGK